jgi:hypothetical protein
MLKHVCLVLILLSVLCLSLWAVENNDFYSKTPLRELGALTLEVAGEVEQAGPVDLAVLPKHELLVRSTDLAKTGPDFIGAYRCSGYSLFDILKDRLLKKKTAAEFNLPLDLYVIVENAAGERVVLGWGEIFYPAQLHRVVIATAMAPIVPSKTGHVWPLPDKPVLVCGTDLYTVRALQQPTRLTVVSAAGTVPVNKGLKPLYAGDADVVCAAKSASLAKLLGNVEERDYPCFFYGRGMGFHGFERFQGRLLGQALAKAAPLNRDSLRRGLWLISGADGYRVVLSWSEIANRNDQAEFLVVNRGRDEKGGRFSLYPTPDFFSDRAVKALREIRWFEIPVNGDK